MTEKLKILFISEGASLAHVARMAILAKSLDEGKYDVYFSCDPYFKEILDLGHSIKYLEITSVLQKDFARKINKGTFTPKYKDILFDINQELELIDQIKPSIVVGDLRLTVPISAALRKIKSVTITNIHWSPFRILDFDPIAPIASFTKIRRYILKHFLPINQLSTTQIYNEVRKKYNLSIVNDYCELATTGDFILYADPPGYIKTRPLPDNHLFLGPILWSPETPKPDWWGEWDKTLPIIYVSLGSTGSIKTLPQILNSLKKFNANILIATAQRFDRYDYPKNFFFSDYLPGLDVCEIASVVVSNGGSATTYQAINYGKPVIGVWSNIDQYLTSKIIESHGAGISYNAHKFSRDSFEWSIQQVLEKMSFRSSSEKLRITFSGYKSSQRFSKYIEEIIQPENKIKSSGWGL